MKTVPGAWRVNLSEMTCKNSISKVEVEFDQNQKGFGGRIKYMPMELLEKCVERQFGEHYIRETIMDAQGVFLRAFYREDLKKVA